MLSLFSGHTPNFKIGVWKVQDFGNFELSSMYMVNILKFRKLFFVFSTKMLVIKVGNHKLLSE